MFTIIAGRILNLTMNGVDPSPGNFMTKKTITSFLQDIFYHQAKNVLSSI